MKVKLLNSIGEGIVDNISTYQQVYSSASWVTENTIVPSAGMPLAYLLITTNRKVRGSPQSRTEPCPYTHSLVYTILNTISCLLSLRRTK